VARYGGEEFIAILPNTKLHEASLVAARICRHVKALKLPHPNSTASPFVTLSCGVASTQTEAFPSMATLIEAADLALYAAKAEGRDRYSLKAPSSVSER
jgi:diguanylate cyclase (GGDEF)-like protein